MKGGEPGAVKRAPLLLGPVEMALELKEHILHQLPASHVRLEEVHGLPPGGSDDARSADLLDLLQRSLAGGHYRVHR